MRSYRVLVIVLIVVIAIVIAAFVITVCHDDGDRDATPLDLRGIAAGAVVTDPGQLLRLVDTSRARP